MAQDGTPRGKCLMEFIAMRTRKTEPKPAAIPPATRHTGDQPRFVGVDLHKRVATFHVLSQDGTSVTSGSFDVGLGSIQAFAAEHLHPSDHLAVEVTSNTWAFVRLVRPYVANVVVSNPLKTKAIAEANVKTDKVDARVLADLLRCNYLPSVWVPTPAVEDNRAMAARRTALVHERTRIRNRIHSVLARRLIAAPGGDLFSGKGLTWLKRVQLEPLDRALVDADLRLLDALARESAAIDAVIAHESFNDTDVQLLMTMPGVDYTIAHALKAALADVGRFSDPDKAASYLGLVPSVKQSAGKCYTGPITKAGATQVRWLLIQGAQRVGRHPGPLGAFFRKLAKRKNRNVAVVATARKMVTIAVHMLKNKEPYRYALPRTTDEKLAALRVKATGEKRRTGIPKGTKPVSKIGAGKSRTTPALDEVYTRQGLPSRRPRTKGEDRMIRESGTEHFVASLDGPTVAAKK
jgi:transposase